MRHSRKLGLVANLILCFVLQTLGADKYTDENRPYEFGFKIDGQQHRHESKDENGIIMGEFGFVTADDVYHVTVYATDKEGRFKILSMKNIHLKSNSASVLGTPTSARQGHSLAQPAPPASVQISASPKQSGVSTQPRLGPFAPQASPVSQGPQHKPISIEPPRGSCSSCSLPTTTTRAPPPAYNQVTNNNNYNNPNQIGAPGFAPQNQPVFLSTPVQQNNARPQQNYPSGQQNYPSVQQNVPQREIVAPNSAFAPQPGQAVQNYPNSPNYSQEPGISNAPNNAQGRPSGSSNIPAGGQQIYASRPQNIPQGELVAPDGAQPFAPQSGQVPQNYPSSSSYSPKPGVFNAPNTYAQPERGAGKQPVLPPANPQNPRYQKALFGSNKNPYTGAGPSVPANTAPDGGNFDFGQNNAQPAGLSGPNKPQLPGKSSNPPGEAGERTAKQYRPEQPFNSNLEPYGSQGPNTARGAQSGTTKPMLVTAQMQIVDKNTDIYALGPNEQRGLPPGLSQGDMTQLLYTFNYTVGFHGHFEEGYANGVKKGYYFVTGRNGVRTRIDYVADDTGFHPKVSQEVLDLLSDDVPKPETEKDEKYGLKGYEFKWLYYPVETK